MPSEPTIRELIDACRPDHNDPQLPEQAAELAPLVREVGKNAQVAAALERSQQFDRQVRSALDDVPLPAGLAERMLAGCEAATVTPAAKEEPKLRPGISRRKLLLAGFSIAASLLLFVTGGWEAYQYWIRSTRPVTAEELAVSALKWRDLSGPSANWQAVSMQTLTAFPMDRAIVVHPSRCLVLDDLNVAVYELNRQQGNRALLVVQRTSRPHAIRNFAYQPLPASGVVQLGAWQRGEFVYVIILNDRDQSIGSFIRPIPQA